MSTFGGISFTNKGKILQAKALTGIQLNFSRLAVGDGNLTGQVIADLSALINEVKSLAITTLKNTNDGKATVGGVLTNQDLVAGFYWRELGLFATDPDVGEILYCYGNAAALAEYIAAGGGADLIEKQINIVAIVGNATSISATINSSLVFASPTDVSDSLIEAKAYTDQEVSAVPVPSSLPADGGNSTTVNGHTVSATPITTEKIDLIGMINELFTDANDLKIAVANAITARGVTASITDISTLLATKIGQIQSVLTGNMGASDLLSGHTGYGDNPLSKIIGLMVDRGTVNITPSTVNQAITGGKHSGSGIVAGDADLNSANILSGKNIFGVAGNVYTPFATLQAGYAIDIYTNNTSKNVYSNTTPQKMFEYTMGRSGSLTIVGHSRMGNTGYGYWQCYVNGVPKGSAHSASNYNDFVGTDTISFNAGDKFQIYLWTSTTGDIGVTLSSHVLSISCSVPSDVITRDL